MIKFHQNKFIRFICVLDFIHAHYWFKCLENLFDISLSCVWVLYLSKLILELIVKNIDISSYMCIGSYPYTLSFKSVQNILFLYFKQFWKNCFSNWRLILKNTDFCLRLNFYITKMVQNICNMCWFLITHICTSMCFNELIFVDSMWFE